MVCAQACVCLPAMICKVLQMGMVLVKRSSEADAIVYSDHFGTEIVEIEIAWKFPTDFKWI